MLYIVSTPIGNLQDITLRAIETLKNADLIVCEDTRVTGKLLNHLGINKKMVPMNDANEENKIYEVLELLENGKNVALVSDSGTPLISDPGFKLVRAAIQKGIRIIPIPGASAVTTALSAAGLPTDKFLFLGFPSDSVEKKKKLFQNVKEMLEFSTHSTGSGQASSNNIKPTVVFYESPHKLLRCLEALEGVFGDIDIVVAREMTKIYEEFLSMKISEQKKHFELHPPKGEFVILFRL